MGLPLIENSSIVEQPLDLWTLTEKYKSAATKIIHHARYRSFPNVEEIFVSAGDLCVISTTVCGVKSWLLFLLQSVKFRTPFVLRVG